MPWSTGVRYLRLSPAGDVLKVDSLPVASTSPPPGKVAAPELAPLLERIRAWIGSPAAAKGPTTFEHTWSGLDGVPSAVRLFIVPARSSTGELIHFEAFLEDVTARDEARQERVPLLFFASILEALPNPVFVKDEDHRWVLLNDSFCRFMGYERSQLLGRSDHDFFPKSEADVFWAKDDAVFSTGQINENEEIFTDSSGRAHVILTRKSLHADAEGRRYLVGTITDITDRKTMEDELRRSRDDLDRRVGERTAELYRLNEQLQAEDRRKTEFLAILGHELRNPLTPIRNAVYALKHMGPFGGPQDRSHSIIERQVAQMARLIDDLLDVSRIARGKVLLQESRFDLVALVRAAVEDRAEVLEAHGLALGLRLPASPLVIVGDPVRIVQAVGNLLDNAQKFTDPGGRIDVTLAASPDGATAAIGIRDSGIGMPPEIIPHLFEPFSQPADSLRRGGLGLGLALVKGLVELHGGSVSVASPGSGKGSEFTIRLPLGSPTAVEDTPAAPSVAHARLRVLIVEDNKDAAESLSLVLEMAGHEVAVVHAGEQAVEAAAELRADVVLSDIGLGGQMTGYDVARSVRARHDLRFTRLVAVTGYGQEGDRRRAIDAGFDEYLVKPFDIDALTSVLDRLAADRTVPTCAGRNAVVR